MRKLLIPVDSSECALRALRHAIGLATDNGPVALHLVNVHEPPIVYGEVALYLPETKAREMLRQRSAEILAPALDLAGAAGVQHTSEIVEGDAATAITRTAVERGCDGIVMGTRGMGAIGNLVLGSVATKVIHLTALPVTLVK